MKCPKCNNNINFDSQYCNKCGQKIDNNHSIQYDYSTQYSNIYRPTATSDEDYIRKYIGASYDVVKKEKFSIVAFIFGPFYLLVKKVYALAILILLITIAIYSYDSNISYIFYSIISTYIGLKGTSIYLQQATRKVEEIKISNPDKSSTEILEICEKEGNSKKEITIILIAIITICTVYTFNILNTKIISNQNEIINDKEIIEETTAYRTKNISYELYTNINTTAQTSNYIKHEYKDKNNSCHIIIIVDKFIPIYKNIDEYIEKNIYINKYSDSIEDNNQSINNINFRVKTIKTQSNNRTLLFATNKDEIYQIEYSENNSFNNNLCRKNIEKFMETISFNE